MRSQLLLVATIVATSGGAQAPLTIDPSFNVYYTPSLIDERGSWVEVYDIALRPDGNLLINGFNGQPPAAYPVGVSAVLIDHDGSYIPSEFENGFGSGHITELSNGQYFVRNRRYDHYGARDWSYGWLVGVRSGDPVAWHILDDRSGYLGGNFIIHEGDPAYVCLIKVHPDGAFDSTFTPRHAGLGKTMTRFDQLQNGQFLINGNWSQYEGYNTGPLVRIYPDGSPDLGFHFPAWKAIVAASYEQPDGKLILGGQFYMNNMLDTLKLLRVNTDGSLDEAFYNDGDYRMTDLGAGGMLGGVNVLTRLDDDRFVVGGSFTKVDEQPRNCICCVDALGNLLDCWAGGGLVPQTITASGYPHMHLGGFECFPNGECYLWGRYSGFVDANGLHEDQVVMSRIFGPTVGLEEHGVNSAVWVWPNPGTDICTVSGLNVNSSTRIIMRDAIGRVVQARNVTSTNAELNTADLRTGLYFVELENKLTRHTLKWVKQ